MIEYKREMEDLVDQLKKKIERKKTKERFLKETLGYRE
jgi:hypothetical protein